MLTESNEKRMKFSDYIFILYKWKKLLFINLFFIVLITSIVVLLIPNTYKSTTTIMIPPDNQSAFGGLASLIGGKSSLASVGSRMFGISNTSEDLLLGIINSRTSLTKIIRKFHLIDYYKIKNNNIDKTIKAFSDDLSADANEYGMIEINVINENPKVSANIANYIAKLVDSVSIKINIENAKNNRVFLEKRYLQNLKDLKNAENNLYKFQKKYGIVAIPEQIEVSVKIAAELEAELMKKEIEAHFILQQYGLNSPQYLGIKAELELLQSKVNELKNSYNLSRSSNVIFPFKNLPDIAIDYLRAFREVEIQQSILEIVMPMYEQAKVEEQKSIPTVLVLDKAVPPQVKYGPKRTAIVLGFVLLFLLSFIPLIFTFEKAINRVVFDNPLQAKMKVWSQKIANFYRIKF